MSRKKNDTADADRSANAPRPMALLAMVVLAGTFSYWFWHRPLTPEAIEAVQGIPTSAWSPAIPPTGSMPHHPALIAPSVTPPTLTLEERGSVVPGTASTPQSSRESVDILDDSLTGNIDLALTPFHESSSPLDSRLADEPLPMVPVPYSLGARRDPLPEPTLWTNAPLRFGDEISPTIASQVRGIAAPGGLTPEMVDDGLAAASPFRVPKVGRDAPAKPSGPLLTDLWPDQGFDPARRPSSSVAAGAVAAGASHTDASQAETAGERAPWIPDSRMSLSSNRIRTKDVENAPARAPAATDAQVRDGAVPSNSNPNSTPAPAVPSSQRIRQPR